MYDFVKAQMNTASNTDAYAPAYSSCGQMSRMILGVAFAASFLFALSFVRLIAISVVSVVVMISVIIIISVIVARILIGNPIRNILRIGVNG